MINSMEKKLLGIKEDEFGFRVEDKVVPKPDPVFESFPTYKVHYSYEEDNQSFMTNNTSIRNDTVSEDYDVKFNSLVIN